MNYLIVDVAQIDEYQVEDAAHETVAEEVRRLLAYQRHVGKTFYQRRPYRALCNSNNIIEQKFKYTD